MTRIEEKGAGGVTSPQTCFALSSPEVWTLWKAHVFKLGAICLWDVFIHANVFQNTAKKAVLSNVGHCCRFLRLGLKFQTNPRSFLFILKQDNVHLRPPLSWPTHSLDVRQYFQARAFKVWQINKKNVI